MEIKGNKYGTHRVIQPKGVLTQAALKIDNGFDTVYSNEIVCDVTSLNIDSASFTQIENECGGDADKIARRIEQIVAEHHGNAVVADEVLADYKRLGESLGLGLDGVGEL